MSQRIYTEVCLSCGKSFISRRKDKKTCSKKCYNQMYYDKKVVDEITKTPGQSKSGSLVQYDRKIIYPKTEHNDSIDMEWAIEFLMINFKINKITAKNTLMKWYPLNDPKNNDIVYSAKLLSFIRHNSIEELEKCIEHGMIHSQSGCY